MSLRDDLLLADTKAKQADVLNAAFIALGYTGSSLRDRLLAADTVAEIANVLDAACIACNVDMGGQSVRDRLLVSDVSFEVANVLNDVLAPVAAFSADDTSGEAPFTVTFTDASTNTPTGWLWEFGDGETSTEQNPEHEYAEEGTYTVTLTVASAVGSGSETKTDYIEATEAEEPSYVGPLDLVPGAVVAYSQRAMTAGSTANAVMISKTGDDTGQNFALVNNAVDLAAIAAYVGGADPFVRTLYDLSGNARHQTQDDPGGRCPWTANISNSKPGALTFGEYSLEYAQEFAGDGATCFVVAKAETKMQFGSGGATPAYVVFNSGQLAYSDVANELGICRVDYANILSDDSLFIWEFVATPGGSFLLANGNPVTQTAIEEAGTTFPFTVNNASKIEVNSGGFAEMLVYPSILSAGDRLLLRQNIATYYGISLAP